MNLWFGDVRYALRTLAKSPGFTVISVLTLALGIGANTAIFSVVKGVVLRSPPYPAADELAMVWQAFPDVGVEQTTVSPPNFIDLRAQSESFEDMATFRWAAFNLTGRDTPRRIIGSYVSASFFEIMGVNPLLGRTFDPKEDQPGADRVAVLGHGLWEREFGSDESVLGQSVTFSNEVFTVVGVMPPGFQFPNRVELWAPYVFTPDELQARSSIYLQVIGRLKPRVTLQAAQTEMDTIAARLESAYPDANTGWGVSLVSLQDQIVGHVRPSVIAIFGATGFVLLLACANVANLLLSRNVTRSRELAIRAALGASRVRLAAQLLTESAVLSLAGGTLGVLLATWSLDLLARLNPGNLPRMNDVKVDLPVLGFALLASLLVAGLAGLLPVMHSTRHAQYAALKEGSGRTTAGRGGRRLRHGLMVGEIALGVVLLAGAGLMIRSFWRLQNVDPGFQPDGIYTSQIVLPSAVYTERSQQVAFFGQLAQQLEAIPVIRGVAAASTLPLQGAEIAHEFHEEGKPPATPADAQAASWDAVLPGYFRLLGIPLLRGRTFTENDSADTPRVVIIDETMARRFWPDEDPIGRRINITSRQAPSCEIIGIVASVRHDELASKAGSRMYVPFAQDPRANMNLTIRSDLPAAQITDALKSACRTVDPDQSFSPVRPMSRYISADLAQPRFIMWLLGVFAALGLLLAAVGIYGVMAYSVAQQTGEFGIRVALGAQVRDILRLVLRQGSLLVGFGLAVGIVSALALTRLLSSMLYGIEPNDPVTLIEVALVLAAVALLACYIPARRATRVDPMVALRCE